nr:hypothetical protein [uncultured Flavobacterium sp.]
MTVIFKKGFYLFLLFLSVAGFAQTAVVPQSSQEKKIEFGFEGMVGLAFGEKTIGITVGGPSLKFKCNKNFKIGVGAFPSLVVIDDKAFPRLAVSPIIEYRHWMIITPYYGYDADDNQIWTYGVGYRF